jgi:hypothetical protein
MGGGTCLQNLETRPVFHFTERRIEAHICSCFIAYKVYKELERLVALSKIDIFFSVNNHCSVFVDNFLFHFQVSL